MNPIMKKKIDDAFEWLTFAKEAQEKAEEILREVLPSVMMTPFERLKMAAANKQIQPEKPKHRRYKTRINRQNYVNLLGKTMRDYVIGLYKNNPNDKISIVQVKDILYSATKAQRNSSLQRNINSSTTTLLTRLAHEGILERVSEGVYKLKVK